MNGLPRFVAALAALSVLAWGFTGLVTESVIGRASSTAGIAFVFVPILAGVASAAGYAVGTAVRGLLMLVRKGGAGTAAAAPPRWPRPAAVALLVLVPAMFGVSAARTVTGIEAAARPRVLETTAAVVRAERAGPPAPGEAAVEAAEGARRRARRIHTSRVTAFAAARPAHLPEPVLDGMSVSFARAGRHSRTLQLPGLDYVTSIDAIELMRQGEVAAYAYVISGRATGRRALVVLLSDSLDVLHAELVMRRWPLGTPALCAAPAADVGVAEIAVIGCGSTTEVTLRLAQSAAASKPTPTGGD